MLSRTYESAIAFTKRNERRLSTLVFVFGFVSDLLTFGFLDLSSVTKLFIAYLVFAAACTLIAHRIFGRESIRFLRAANVLLPLFVQFALGSLLSGFLIFYTKSAVLLVSWPFLILLALIFFGNEVFRGYREHLVFQTVLLYFSLYAFAIFALPIYLGRLGKEVFLISTAISVGVFALYLIVLALLGWQRLKGALALIILSASAATTLIVASYLTGILPPIPLTLKDGGIYQSVTHTNDTYEVIGEPENAWWDPRTTLVHHVPGTSLSAYSSVFAPGAFSATIVHRWQRYDETKKAWLDQATIAFVLSGGRSGGYRGYSVKNDPQPGKWRVLVETIDGQVISELPFSVVNVMSAPQVETQTK